jgi:hypothetical protein
MKFIEVAHPEGGRFIFHIDHVTSAHFRPAQGEGKSRLNIDLDERQNEVVLLGEEADRAWERIQTVVAATTSD